MRAKRATSTGARPLRAGRVGRGKVLAQLQQAARKGDRTALMLAVDQMRTLAYSPRYWEKYLLLLAHPLARLVDLLVIKQGDRIARQKGWPRPRRRLAKADKGLSARRSSRRQPPSNLQPSLFPDLP